METSSILVIEPQGLLSERTNAVGFMSLTEVTAQTSDRQTNDDDGGDDGHNNTVKSVAVMKGVEHFKNKMNGTPRARTQSFSGAPKLKEREKCRPLRE